MSENPYCTISVVNITLAKHRNEENPNISSVYSGSSMFSGMNWTGASESQNFRNIFRQFQTVITFQSSTTFPECLGVFKQVRKDTRKSISNKFMVNLETETFKILFLWVFYIFCWWLRQAKCSIKLFLHETLMVSGLFLHYQNKISKSFLEYNSFSSDWIYTW
jgi:hypothetical protein